MLLPQLATFSVSIPFFLLVLDFRIINSFFNYSNHLLIKEREKDEK